MISENNFSSDSAAASRMIDAEETYCYNERNELTKRKTLSEMTEYLYDENGSLVREKEGSRTASCRYDLLNRQTHVTTFDGREQENLYDGEGLRAGLKENGKLSTFLYYNGEILAECGGGKIEDSVPVRRYQRGISLFQVEDTATGISHIYSRDEQKSTVYITGSDGAVENCYAYDAFGNVLESRENIENRICYTGQQYDQVTGQHYLRARYYNPVIGRFTQEDTYRGDGLNLYAYCGNNPVRYHDPSGHDGTEYLENPSSENGQSRVEQVDGEFGNVAGNGGLEFEGNTGTQIIGTSYDATLLRQTQPYTDKNEVRGLVEYIAANGADSVDPILVRVYEGTAYIVDGHHRYNAFLELGYDRVPIKYLHDSDLGKMLPDGTFVRTLEDILAGAKLCE